MFVKTTKTQNLFWQKGRKRSEMRHERLGSDGSHGHILDQLDERQNQTWRMVHVHACMQVDDKYVKYEGINYYMFFDMRLIIEIV
jgi:hypothetical protein